MTSSSSRIDRRGRAAALGLVASLAVSWLAGAAGAQPSAGRAGLVAPGPSFVERYGDRLGLDEEARASIEGVVEVTRSTGEGRRAERHVIYERMDQLLAVDEPDEGKVLELVERLGILELADHKDRLLAMLAIRAVLTPAQRAELLAIRADPRSFGRGPGLGPCNRDAARLCSQAEPGRGTLRCLDASWDELSGHCQAMFQNPSKPAPAAARAPAD
jgi:Spy/CpxP family protein refolding chaperone